MPNSSSKKKKQTGKKKTGKLTGRDFIFVPGLGLENVDYAFDIYSISRKKVRDGLVYDMETDSYFIVMPNDDGQIGVLDPSYDDSWNIWSTRRNEPSHIITARVVRNCVYFPENDENYFPKHICFVHSLLEKYWGEGKFHLKKGQKIKLPGFSFLIEDITGEKEQKSVVITPEKLLDYEIIIDDPLYPKRMPDIEKSPILSDVLRPFFVPETRYPEYTLEDIILKDDLKEEVSVLIDKISYPEKYPFPEQIVLFSGYPGTGKTMLAKVIPKYVDCSFFYVSSNYFLGSGVGETSQKIEEFFYDIEDIAEDNKVLLVLDEFDSIGLSREHSSVNGGVVEAVGSLLTKLDYPPANVSVIAITNHPGIVDEAILSRCKKNLVFDLPDFAQIKQYSLMIMDKYGEERFDNDFKENLDPLLREMESFKLSFRTIRDVFMGAADKATYKKTTVTLEMLKKEMEAIMKKSNYRPLPYMFA